MWRDTNERAHADLAGELFRKTKAKRKNRRGESRTIGSVMPNDGQNCPLKPKWYVLASMPIRKSVSAAGQRVARQSALKLFTDRKHERELLGHFFEGLAKGPLGARRTARKTNPEYLGSRWDR